MKQLQLAIMATVLIQGLVTNEVKDTVAMYKKLMLIWLVSMVYGEIETLYWVRVSLSIVVHLLVYMLGMCSLQR